MTLMSMAAPSPVTPLWPSARHGVLGDGSSTTDTDLDKAMRRIAARNLDFNEGMSSKSFSFSDSRISSNFVNIGAALGNNYVASTNANKK